MEQKQNNQPYKNNEIRETIKSVLNLEQYTDKVPAVIEDKIQLSIDVTPQKNKFCDVVKRGTATNATSATIYTTPTDQDFYLTTAYISYIKDVTSTSTSSAVQITVNGSAVTVLNCPQFTLTVGQNTSSLNFSTPIKVDRGTGITITNSTNVGNITSMGIITGYTVDSNTYDMGIGAQR